MNRNPFSPWFPAILACGGVSVAAAYLAWATGLPTLAAWAVYLALTLLIGCNGFIALGWLVWEMYCR